MRWEKRGVVLAPPTHLPWVASHAAVPFAVEPTDADDLVTVYFTTRDARGRSHIARAHLDVDDPARTRVDRDPALAPGPLGAFDDAGTMMSSLVRDGDRELLYYQGWSLGITVPFYVFAGCAKRRLPDGPFERVSPAPILGRTRHDPFLVMSPWVLVENGVWRMWYASGVGWTSQASGPALYRVVIKHAESDDGLIWRADGRVCIDFADPSEYAFSRPVVRKEDGLYQMWYSVRGDAFRIGYAESRDGLDWERKDTAAGIDAGVDGFDSEMIEYGVVFDHRGTRHMLFNGNGFGATGIGHAVLVEGRRQSG